MNFIFSTLSTKLLLSLYVSFRDKNYVVNATEETSRLGRLVNHSRTSPNVMAKVKWVDGRPRLLLHAMGRLKAGEELTFDYGERNKEVIQANPWLTD